MNQPLPLHLKQDVQDGKKQDDAEAEGDDDHADALLDEDDILPDHQEVRLRC